MKRRKRKQKLRPTNLDKKFPQMQPLSRSDYERNLHELLEKHDSEREKKIISTMTPEAIEVLATFLLHAKGEYFLGGEIDDPQGGASIMYWPRRLVSPHKRIAPTVLIGIGPYGGLMFEAYDSHNVNDSMAEAIDLIDTVAMKRCASGSVRMFDNKLLPVRKTGK